MNTADIIAAVVAIEQAILAAENEIEALDRAIGDGDHFINVRRGCSVIAAMSGDLATRSPDEALTAIGAKLLSTIGGASGPLFASLFLAMGKTLKGNPEPSPRDLAAAFTAGVDAIRSRGKADVGEKTMLDVLIPVARLFDRLSGAAEPMESLCAALKEESLRGMLSTRDMIATKGRANFLGDRAIGHLDPGSKTCQVAIWAVCDLLTGTAPTLQRTA